MIGTRITVIPRRSVAAWVLLFIAAVIGLPALTLNKLPAAVVALPFALAAVFMLRREQVQVFELQEDILRLEHESRDIYYHTIHAIEYLPTEKKPKSSIVISLPSDSVLIPANADADLEQVFLFLCNRMQFKNVGYLSVPLTTYYDEQAARYGESRVLRIEARRHPGRHPASAKTLRFSRAMWLSAALVIPAVYFEAGFVAEVGICIVLGLVTCLLGRDFQKRSIPKLSESAIVVSPEGIAMHQGEVRGAMEWSRVRKMYLHPPHAVESSHLMMGQIILEVGSSRILIRDVYRLPLFLLFTVLKAARENSVVPPPRTANGVPTPEQDDSPQNDSPFRPPRAF